MKNLFTYPANPGTYYVNPDHIGDGTYGMSQRINDTLIGNAAGKKRWTGINPIEDLGRTWQTVTPYISKYVNYIDTSAPRPLSTYEFWLAPVVVVPLREMQQPNPGTFVNIKYPDSTWNVSLVFTTAELAGMRVPPVNGSKITMGGVGTVPLTELMGIAGLTPELWYSLWTSLGGFFGGSSLLPNFFSTTSAADDFNGKTVYLELASSTVDGSVFRIWEDAGFTVPLAAGDRPSGISLVNDQVRFVKHDSGVRAVQALGVGPAFKTGDTVKFTELFTNTNAGDLSNTTSEFYVNYEAGIDPTGQSFTLWQDSAFTTPVSVTESYLDSSTLSYTNSGTEPANYSLFAINIAGKTDLINYLTAHNTAALCRVWFSNLSGGAISSPVDPKTQAIPDARSTTQTFWAKYNSEFQTINIVEDINDPTNTRAEFTLSAGASVDINIDIIDAIHFDVAGAELYPSLNFNDADDWYTPYSGADAYKEADTTDIILPGNSVYTYLDNDSEPQFGAQVKPNVLWWPGATTSTVYDSDNYPEFTVDVDAEGRLSAVNLGADRGQFLTTDSEFLVEIQSKFNLNVVFAVGKSGLTLILVNGLFRPFLSSFNQYNLGSPPTLEEVGSITPDPLTAPYEPDVWDTEDQWTLTGYTGPSESPYYERKLWPTHVAPQSAKITVSQPSSINRSQNGTKYVRSAGLVRYQVEVEYPPMSQDDFQIYFATVEAARGQTTPFLFTTMYNGKKLFFGNQNHQDWQARQAYASLAGETVIRLEALEPNLTDAIVIGQHLTRDNTSAVPNGGLAQSISHADSNIYGEVQFRMPYGLSKDTQAGLTWYSNPQWVIVTLANSELEYSIDTDNLYRFKVTFDLDEWK